MRLNANSIAIWFGAIMIVLVITLAIAVGLTDFMSESLYGAKRKFFVVLMLAYAVYRGFRIYQLLKYKNNHEK